MKKICELKDVHKSLSGREILRGIDLDIYEGEILGILGPNASGKTTLLKLMTDYLNMDSGSILIDGQEPGVYTKSVVSYMPDESFIPGNMTGEEIRDFYIDFFKDFNSKKFEKLSSYMDINLEEKVKNMSKGLEERLNISLTLSRDSKLYILDEPLGGVDIITRDKILNTIIDSFNEKSALIITTHLIGEMEYIFDRVAFIDQGKISIEGRSEDLRSRYKMSPEALYRNIFREED